MAQQRTQLAALRWVQLVGVRGSSIHTGQNWVERRTTVGEGVSEVKGSCCEGTPVSGAQYIGFVMSVLRPYKYIFCQKKKVKLCHQIFMAKMEALLNLHISKEEKIEYSY